MPLEDICEDVLDFVDQLPEYQAGIEVRTTCWIGQGHSGVAGLVRHE